jgi:hypothetical protein
MENKKQLMDLNGNTKMKIETLEIAGIASVLRALRLPFGKDCRSDATSTFEEIRETLLSSSCARIHEKDMKLMSTLVKRGDEHAKALRGIVVYAEISAPIWFYRELETYRIGRERLSSESTMHIECKGLSGEELEKAKDAIPMGHIQKTVDMFSYQCLRRIYFQRRNHRLPMWHDFCKWIESLPYAHELIICDKEV